MLAVDELTLPTGECVPVASLCRFVKKRLLDCGPLMHLQRVRRHDLSLAVEYEKLQETYADLLARCFEPIFDALVSPPSRFDFADSYRDKLQTKMPSARDLTAHIVRCETAPLSGHAASVDEIVSSLTVEIADLPDDPISLLIVDDVIEEGKTAAALLTVLRRAGIVTDRVAVACPLRIVS